VPVPSRLDRVDPCLAQLVFLFVQLRLEAFGRAPGRGEQVAAFLVGIGGRRGSLRRIS